MTLPHLSSLGTAAPQDEFERALGVLFEPVPVLAQRLSSRRPFDSYESLLDTCHSVLFGELSQSEQIEVINAHPRIGGTSGHLSALSASEQGKIVRREHCNSDDEYTQRIKYVSDTLVQLNEQYEAKFGFKYVVFVNGRSREELIPEFKERLSSGTADGELTTAMRAVVDIARQRLKNLTS
ncbi:hypothetical protein GQ42DRAFT_17329 [Ramicandelaber brevisporus]|nr:hypothetical protein GQ42DRAFT_17329 [Ramicandelaber brevisporus]